ncbi:MAG TPA: hypothetical protein VGD69_22685 [Herpetosiphonaceae bacterium]
MASWYRKDLEQEEFSIRDRDTLAPVPLRASASSRHNEQQKWIDQLQLTVEKDVDPRDWLRRAFIRHWGPKTNLCLFNVIVAFEWAPNYNDLRLLREATTSASDLLYDVTDGYMAIGKVFVGGPELMKCADIQILASNRLFPRSTVDGLNEEQKYQPIRLGRGLWHKNSRITLPWDSELGFKTLVHEWGHYALGLKDQYLELQSVEQDQKVVIPVRNPVLDTIMASLEKEALLGEPKTSTDPDSEWSGLRTHPAFLWLEIPRDREPEKQDKPPKQQPRPGFHLVGKVRQDKTEKPHPVLRWDQTLESEHKISADHCWVYVVRGDIRTPEELIAQGEIESIGALVDHRIDGPALQLLGAEKGDTIVLVGHRDGKPLEPLTLCAKIEGFQDREVIIAEMNGFTNPPKKWATVTPDEIPPIGVTADIDPRANKRQLPELKLSEPIKSSDWRAFIFEPSMQGVGMSTYGNTVTAMDGHIMLVNQTGDLRLAIVGFSLGGSPDSGFPVHPNPIPAGSADGNAMIFFYQPSVRLNYEEMNTSRYQQKMSSASWATPQVQTLPPPPLDSYRIVVTTNCQQRDDQDITLKHNGKAKLVEPRSYTFGVTTNLSLVPLRPEPTEDDTTNNVTALDYFPTLVLYYDNKALFDDPKAVSKEDLEAKKKKLVIARYVSDNKWEGWTPDVSEDSVAALPLNSTTAPGLFPKDGQPKPEYFRLFLLTE